MFRFEPFILAAECRTLETALSLVACGRHSGFRESGVTGTKRFMAGLRSSLRLEVTPKPSMPQCCFSRIRHQQRRISAGMGGGGQGS